MEDVHVLATAGIRLGNAIIYWMLTISKPWWQVRKKEYTEDRKQMLKD